MIVLGLVLLILGLIFGVNLLFVLGVVLLLIGLALTVLHPVGPVRGRWW